MNLRIRDIAESILNQVMSVIPRHKPKEELLRNCKLVAHRGGFDHSEKENTLGSFEVCVQKGLWGIEFDIRWTKDNIPVLLHDEDAGRVFGHPDIVPKNLEFATLRKKCPLIPSLKEVIESYSKKIHFMIELKEDLTEERIQILKQQLKNQVPVEGYHFLSLVPERLLPLKQHFPRESLISVSMMNAAEISEKTLKLDLGGVAGHYLLLSRKLHQRHKQKNQKIGSGFVSSKNSLYREINRGVEWVFTNNPLQMMYLVKNKGH